MFLQNPSQKPLKFAEAALKVPVWAVRVYMDIQVGFLAPEPIIGTGGTVLLRPRVAEFHLLMTLGSVRDDYFGLPSVKCADDCLSHVLRAVRN